MFPNLRLLVVAVLAAIAGISCGLALFATFRVNHEPLMRFSEGGAPLQLAFDNRPALPEAASPIPARLPLDAGGKIASAPLLIPAPPAVEETPAGDGPVPAPQQGSETSGSDAAGEPTIASATPAAASGRAAEDNKPSQGEPEAVAITEPTEPASNGTAASAISEPVVEKNGPSAADDQQTPAKPSKALEIKEESKAVKTPVKAARTAAPVRRPAKLVRRRVPAAVTAQPADQFVQPTYQQPAQTSYQAYQWTDPSAQPRPTVRRATVKRHQAVKKPSPAAQSNLAGATAGVTGPE
jgi:hypothetical protein